MLYLNLVSCWLTSSLSYVSIHDTCWPIARLGMLLRMQGPTMTEMLESLPKTNKWMTRVAECTDPHWRTVSSFLHKVAQRGKEKKLKASQAKL